MTKVLEAFIFAKIFIKQEIINMQYAIPALLCVLLQGCHREAPMPDLTPVASVKDKTRAPDLRREVPANDAIDGWKKEKSTALDQIPANTPSPPEVFYEAQKEIDGRMRTIAVVYGDITEETDAIVNAANSSLEGGSGVDGAIHNAAKVLINGKKEDLMKKEAILYKTHHGITSFPIGSAMVTNPYGLKNISMVVFTVGPQGSSNKQSDLELYSAVYNSLVKANEYDAKSVSIPAISTGIYGFPLERASELFFKAIFQFFYDEPQTSINNVRLTNNDAPTVKAIGSKFLQLFP